MTIETYGTITVDVPDFTPKDIKELRALVGKAERLPKPMSAFAFAVKYIAKPIII